MKKIKLLIVTLAVTIFSVQSQVFFNGQAVDNGIPSSTAFIDASTAFSGDHNFGKGLVFPSVDLRTFEFSDVKDGLADGSTVFQTFFDGMVVYNRGTGNSKTVATEGGVCSSTLVKVEPGFYYYSNPTAFDDYWGIHGNEALAVASGVWKPLGSGSGSSLPPGFCIFPDDCDGDGVNNGSDPDDNNPCFPAATGLTAAATPATITPGSSAVITVGGTGVNNVSIDGGNTLIAGNSITVTPNTTTTYLIRVNNCASQVVAVTVTVQPQTPGVIGTLTCGTNTMNATVGTTISSGNTFSIPYSGATGATIVLTDGLALGSVANGLQVVSNGSQSISGNGNLNIKVTGIPTTATTTTLSYTVGGKTCSVAVSVTELTGTIATLTCGSRTVNATVGTTISSGNTFSIPYSGKSGGTISLTNGQAMGSALNGMQVVANGNQSISASSGSVNIRVAGTPTTATTTTLSYTVGGQSCTVSVISASANVLVSGITVAGASSVQSTQTSTYTATVSPSNATNKNVTWSVINGTGTATITSAGVLTGGTAGTVTVRATAQDGSAKYGERTVTITPNVNSDGTTNMQIGNNSYKTYNYSGVIWMVENSKEGTPSIAPAGANGYYYDELVKTTACPAGWSVPSVAQWNTLAAWVNSNPTHQGAKFWNSVEGNAFAGFYNVGEPRQVGINGYWWSSYMNYGRVGYNYSQSPSSLSLSGQSAMGSQRNSVRCIKD